QSTEITPEQTTPTMFTLPMRRSSTHTTLFPYTTLFRSPFGALGEKLGSGKTLKHGNEVIPDAYCCALVLRTDLIKNQKHVAQSFMADYKKAGYQMDDKSKSVDIMSKHFKQDKKVLTQSAEWTSYGDLSIKKDGYQEITHLVNQHQLFKTPSYKSFVDPT